MASLPKEFTISCKIPIKQEVVGGDNNNITYNVQANTKTVQKFIKKLMKLCKKYGYTINEIQ